MTPPVLWNEDWLGLAAGALTTIAFVPQLVRIMRRRSAADVSLATFATFTAGVLLWLWYGIRLHAWPLIVANLVTLALALAILFFKWRYRCGPPTPESRDS